tara:strand:+ start:133 stop:465 length:333 start_codon:yes stop_codon:yes gene_type:complete
MSPTKLNNNKDLLSEIARLVEEEMREKNELPYIENGYEFAKELLMGECGLLTWLNNAYGLDRPGTPPDVWDEDKFWELVRNEEFYASYINFAKSVEKLSLAFKKHAESSE